VGEAKIRKQRKELAMKDFPYYKIVVNFHDKMLRKDNRRSFHNRESVARTKFLTLGWLYGDIARVRLIEVGRSNSKTLDSFGCRG
jgi:hypothetical protein